MTVYLYRKSHRRQPVCLGKVPILRDIQGAIPAGWCILCGCEVFDSGESLCPVCRNGKGEVR